MIINPILPLWIAIPIVIGLFILIMIINRGIKLAIRIAILVILFVVNFNIILLNLQRLHRHLDLATNDFKHVEAENVD